MSDYVPRAMVEIEREAIVEALTHFRGDKRRVAETLMIGLSTLYRKLLAFEITPADWRRRKSASA